MSIARGLKKRASADDRGSMGRLVIFQRKKVRDVATGEELERRIMKLEERIFILDKAVKNILDFLKRGTEAQSERKSADYGQSEQDQERFKKESDERMNRIMEELGYKIR